MTPFILVALLTEVLAVSGQVSWGVSIVHNGQQPQGVYYVNSDGVPSTFNSYLPFFFLNPQPSNGGTPDVAQPPPGVEINPEAEVFDPETVKPRRPAKPSSRGVVARRQYGGKLIKRHVKGNDQPKSQGRKPLPPLAPPSDHQKPLGGGDYDDSSANDSPMNASYAFEYSGEGQSRNEKSDENGYVEGSYTFVADDGVERRVDYKAGADIGFVVTGDHLPVPPVPDYSGSSEPSAPSGNGIKGGVKPPVSPHTPSTRTKNPVAPKVPQAYPGSKTPAQPAGIPTYGVKTPAAQPGVGGKSGSSDGGCDDEGKSDGPMDASYDFSYNNQDSDRNEKSDANGNVEGSYSFVGDDGVRREIKYTAGAGTGFVVTGDIYPKGDAGSGATGSVPKTKGYPAQRPANVPGPSVKGVPQAPIPPPRPAPKVPTVKAPAHPPVPQTPISHQPRPEFGVKTNPSVPQRPLNPQQPLPELPTPGVKSEPSGEGCGDGGDNGEPGDSSYDFSYKTDDQEHTAKSDADGNVQGSYSYVGPDGVRRQVDYMAGPGIGFVATGEHLPKEGDFQGTDDWQRSNTDSQTHQKPVSPQAPLPSIPRTPLPPPSQKPVHPQTPLPLPPQKPVQPHVPLPLPPQKPIQPKIPLPLPPRKPVHPKTPQPRPLPPQKPIEPQEPVEPQEPLPPQIPQEPSYPHEPQVPVEPSHPFPPQYPSHPSYPSPPQFPSHPSYPSPPQEPIEPSYPSPPQYPQEPVYPEEPQIPLEPSYPAPPQIPLEPSYPTPPQIPYVPHVPIHPQVYPLYPQIPVHPQIPLVPQEPLPHIPQRPIHVPDLPSVPVDGQLPNDLTPDLPPTRGDAGHQTPVELPPSKPDCDPQNRDYDDGSADRSYSFDFASDDQTRKEKSDSEGNVKGVYSFVGPDGIERRVEYEAGPGIGFVAQGDHLPKPVEPIPSGQGESHPSYPSHDINEGVPPRSHEGAGHESFEPEEGEFGNHPADSSYSFTYSTDSHSRSESPDPHGNVKGTFSYVDNNGVERKTDYHTDKLTGSMGRGNYLPEEINKAIQNSGFALSPYFRQYFSANMQNDDDSSTIFNDFPEFPSYEIEEEGTSAPEASPLTARNKEGTTTNNFKKPSYELFNKRGHASHTGQSFPKSVSQTGSSRGGFSFSYSSDDKTKNETRDSFEKFKNNFSLVNNDGIEENEDFEKNFGAGFQRLNIKKTDKNSSAKAPVTAALIGDLNKSGNEDKTLNEKDSKHPLKHVPYNPFDTSFFLPNTISKDMPHDPLPPSGPPEISDFLLPPPYIQNNENYYAPNAISFANTLYRKAQPKPKA